VIYFMQAGGTELIKIGTTIRLSQRLRQIESAIGCACRVLGVMDGSYAEEGELHRKFSHLWLESEWFEPTDELIRFIASVARPWDGEDEVPSALVAMKCRQEYKDWVIRYAREKRTTPSQLIDGALVSIARIDGFELPPDR
jgi:hypothetical protein